MNVDRRRWQRFAQPTKVFITPQAGQSFEAEVQDISAGGAFVLSSHPLPFRARIQIRFQPGGPERTLDVSAEVVRSMDVGFGIEYAEDTPESARQEIVAWVSGEPLPRRAPTSSPAAAKPSTPARGSKPIPPAKGSGGSAPASSRGPRILLVQDDKDMSKLVINVLRQMGADVTSKDDAKSAPAALAQERFDLVILDWQPLDQNPEGMIKALRSAAPRTPLVVVSAMVRSPLFADKLRALGVAQTAPKPCPLNDLIATVDRALARR